MIFGSSETPTHDTGQETGKEQNMVQERGKDKQQTRTKQHNGSEQDKKQKTRYRKKKHKTLYRTFLLIMK